MVPIGIGFECLTKSRESFLGDEDIVDEKGGRRRKERECGECGAADLLLYMKPGGIWN